MRSQADIQALVDKLSSDLEALVRSAAVEAVHSILGGSTAKASHAIAAPPAAAKKKPGAKPKVKANATKAGKAKESNQVRRTMDQIVATANEIHAYVRANPNLRAETIRSALNISASQWKGPLGILLTSKRLIAKGRRAGTTYNVGGASGAGDVVLLTRSK